MTSDPSLVCPVSPEAVYDDSVSITKEDVVIETESLTPTAPPLYPVLPSAHILHQDRAQAGDHLLLCGVSGSVCTVVHKQWLTTVYLSSSVPSSEWVQSVHVLSECIVCDSLHVQ